MITSAIIPAFGFRDLTDACIGSLAKYDPDVEVVVVDNDGHAVGLDADEFIENPRNVGFARACNQGAWASSGDVLVFLNNDCELIEAKSITNLADHALVHGVAGCHLVYPHGGTQHGGVRVFRNEAGIVWAENLHEQGESGFRDAVTGACLAVRRDVFARIEGFDTDFYNGADDVNLCLEARVAGFRSWYEAEITVVHHESASGPERWAKTPQNIALLHQRWHGRLEDLLAQ